MSSETLEPRIIFSQEVLVRNFEIAETILRRAIDISQNPWDQRSFDDVFYTNSEFDYRTENNMSTGRSFEDIADEHGYEIDEFLLFFKNKTVLDIGCGYSDLEKDTEKYGIKTKVVNFDTPNVFFPSKWAEELKDRSESADEGDYESQTKIDVLGLAEKMPFANESFDSVLATYSLPFYVYNADQLEGFFNEVMRILKPNGIASIAPFLSGYRKERHHIGEIRKYGMLRSMSSMPNLVVSPRGNSLKIKKLTSFEP